MSRVIVIATTKANGVEYARRHGLEQPVAVVTPRSPHSARGHVADYWYMTPEVAGHPRIAALVADVLPAVATVTEQCPHDDSDAECTHGMGREDRGA